MQHGGMGMSAMSSQGRMGMGTPGGMHHPGSMGATPGAMPHGYPGQSEDFVKHHGPFLYN